MFESKGRGTFIWWPNVTLSRIQCQQNVWEPLLLTVQNCREVAGIFQFRAQWSPACLRQVECLRAFTLEWTNNIPLFLAKRKENQCDNCEQISRWWGSQPCEMQNAFPPLYLANFKAVTANFICELCATASHGKVLRWLSGNCFGDGNEHIWGWEKITDSTVSAKLDKNGYTIFPLNSAIINRCSLYFFPLH